ncbi:AraC-like DNA-binding protein [Algoriphagus sp. 4150]|uniref:helix-turn-helix domain-containing protein n=1 Tax=Algoriphagus sp. 4150 TaxID=2817756 RepID=UPI002864C570|nr:helix-turn-helix transcriptional regulator [Algoriphagus sp. 4150]MDR7129320.1 AraC-like DNA-binding protein [Algoriphagus sp. 4150]
MKSNKIYKVDSISEFHKVRGLRPPLHPLISLVDYSTMVHLPEHDKVSWLQSYYSISLKKGVLGKYRYGQSEYDFDEGLMSFFAPNQILNIEYVESSSKEKQSGWILLVHPDFLWGSALAKKIKLYGFFDYSLTEALFLSEREEQTIASLLGTIQQEYQANIDKFSQNIIIAQIELLLNYAERFYERQFITRKIENHALLIRLEEVLENFFSSENEGLPSVQFVADSLNVSPNYLSNSLKSFTGQSTQNHIHEKLIEKAKERLSTTALSVSEIAYELGFEHPQSFSKLFKSKTNLSPLAFRQSFN